MKAHTKVYMEAFGYGIEDFIGCEICGNKGVDVHHIENRKAGGDPTGSKDHIANLMCLCREHHLEYGDVPELVPILKKIHLRQLEIHGVKINNEE